MAEPGSMTTPPLDALPLNIIHLDEHLLVIDKPSGLLSVPGRGPDKQDCASARAQALVADALIVHRLDMATSGLLLLARGPDWQRRMSQAFAERQVNKRYEAVVDGSLPNDEMLIDLPMITDWPRRPLQMIDPVHGKPAQTRLQVLSRAADGCSTRVALYPITGRSHQLRLHMQAIGHPILGDMLYATPEQQSRAPRLLLHACELEVPYLGQRVGWQSRPAF